MTNITYFKGTREEVGFQIGQSMGDRLEKIINNMVESMDNRFGINRAKLQKEAMTWFYSIPEDYQKELQGMSKGSGVDLKKIADWYYSDKCIKNGCTSFFIKVNNNYWAGRNNDYILPKFWDHINIIKVEDKIPVMLFGLKGDIFTGTGYNKEKLWIHYNWLPIWDKPDNAVNVLEPFIFIRKALEECENLKDVEDLINTTKRTGGMNLFVLDGKKDECTVFECTGQTYIKRLPKGDYIIGANHYNSLEVPGEYSFDFNNSNKRQKRVKELIEKDDFKKAPQDLIDILSDKGVEQNTKRSKTVYANVACPAQDLIWFAYDGFPAASQSSWEKLRWDWNF